MNFNLQSEFDYLGSSTCQKRMGMPDEVTDTVMFLASKDASFITGTQTVVDGGFMCA